MKRFLFVFSLILALSFARPTHAFTLAPSILEMSVNPGATYTGSMAIGNDEDAERTYYLSIQKFIPKGDSGQQDFLSADDTSGLPSWLFLDRPSVTLKPGATRQLPLSIRVPVNAKAGGYYAAIFFSTQPPTRATNIQTASRTGVLIFLTVKGAVISRLKVVEMALASPASLSHLPVSFRTIVENDGNVHLTPAGTIVVKNFLGNTVAKLAMNQVDGRVLPSSSRRYDILWQDSVPKDGSGFWHELREEWRNFGIGTYTATLTLNGPGAPLVSPPSVSFSIWPWRLMLLFVFGLLALLILAKLYRRKVIRKATMA